MTSLETATYDARLQVGAFIADHATGDLSGPEGSVRLEPKVMDLLYLLAAQPGQVVGRERIIEALWPEVIVGEDSLARTVSRLRQALGDDAKAPRYIETLSKRGYRLLVEVSPAPELPASVGASHARPAATQRWLLIAAVLAAALLVALVWSAMRNTSPAPPTVEDRSALLARADDYYFQFSRAGNESAIELYQRVLGLHPDDPTALAGLANALAQRSIRWPRLPGETPAEFRRLGEALANGHLTRDPARQQLRRAQHLAERAVAVAPESAAAHKAVGFVAGAQGRIEAALASHRRAVELDPDAWGPMINIADLLDISGSKDEALPHYEEAYAAMSRVSDRNPMQVRPWQPELGVLIAQRHRDRGDAIAAEAWYRRVLAHSPLHADATRGYAVILRAGGDVAEARRLCEALHQRTGQACRMPED